MSKFHFILGSADPEMAEIEAMLTGKGIPYSFATTTEGGRVTPAQAYGGWFLLAGLADREIVLVECCPEDAAPIFSQVYSRVIDHHRPGDPGYARPRSEAVAASSLGQVAELLGVELTPRQRAIAALDHCLPAALRGECQGVSAEEALSEMLSRPGAPTGIQIEDADAALAAAPLLFPACPACRGHRVDECQVCGGSGFASPVKDLRYRLLPDRGEVDAGSLPGLPIAATIRGEGYVAIIACRRGDGPPAKLVLGGEVAPLTVESLLQCPEGWAPLGWGAAGAPYGVPSRGFGGLPLVPYWPTGDLGEVPLPQKQTRALFRAAGDAGRLAVHQHDGETPETPGPVPPVPPGCQLWRLTERRPVASVLLPKGGGAVIVFEVLIRSALERDGFPPGRRLTADHVQRTWELCHYASSTPWSWKRLPSRTGADRLWAELEAREKREADARGEAARAADPAAEVARQADLAREAELTAAAVALGWPAPGGAR